MSRVIDVLWCGSGLLCYCVLMYTVTQARVVRRVCRAEGGFLMQATFHSRLPPHVSVNWSTLTRCNELGAGAGDTVFARSLYTIPVALLFCRVRLSGRCTISSLASYCVSNA